jgi:hypothetical protein
MPKTLCHAKAISRWWWDYWNPIVPFIEVSTQGQ